MHYANGKEVEIGDKIIVDDCGTFRSGIVVDKYPGADSCNISIVPIDVRTYLVTSSDALRAQDALIIDKNNARSQDDE